MTLTIDPTSAGDGRTALSQITGSNKDAAVFALNPKTGAVLADYSTPTFDPNALASPDVAAEKLAGYAYFNQKDAEGSLPGRPAGDGGDVSPRIHVQGRDDDGRLQPRPRSSRTSPSPCLVDAAPNSNKLLSQRWRRGVRRRHPVDAAGIV